MNFFKSLFLTIMVSLALNADTNEKEQTLKIHQDLYENVVLKNAKDALSNAELLSDLILAKENDKAKEQFKEFIASWKKVQAFYILGDLDEEYLDTPRFIDTFHHGNEDIKSQLDLILASKDKVSDLIYKNSHKSVNALEYILFTKDIKDSRVNEALVLATDAIKMHLEDIYNGYKDKEKEFYNDDKKANAMIINALIESSYKLKEWRVADVAGYSKKYKNNPDITRGEYYISKNSKTALLAILSTYKDVMDSPKYKNFGDYFKEVVKIEEIDMVVNNINKSIKLANKIKNDDLRDTKKLYKTLKKVHIGFYIYLIDALKMNAKILDADGD